MYVCSPRVDIRYEAAGSCGLRKSFDSSIIEQECLKSRSFFRRNKDDFLILELPVWYCVSLENWLEHYFFDVTPRGVVEVYWRFVGTSSIFRVEEWISINKRWI